MIVVAAFHLYNGGMSVYNGPYEITLTDITGVKQMVSAYSGSTTRGTSELLDPTDGDSVDFGSKFTTGAPTAGYLLDRIKVLLFVGDGGAVPAISLHPNTSSGPGTKLCDLTVPDRVVHSPVVRSSTPPHTFLAPDCADDTLAASTNYWVVFSDVNHVAYELAFAENQDVRDYGSGWDMTGHGKRGATNLWAETESAKIRGGLWAKQN